MLKELTSTVSTRYLAFFSKKIRHSVTNTRLFIDSMAINMVIDCRGKHHLVMQLTYFKCHVSIYHWAFICCVAWIIAPKVIPLYHQLRGRPAIAEANGPSRRAAKTRRSAHESPWLQGPASCRQHHYQVQLSRQELSVFQLIGKPITVR